MRKVFCILSVTVLTFIFIIVLVNIVYWGFIFSTAKAGKWAIVVMAGALLFSISGYIAIVKSLMEFRGHNT
jgi:hypothetical protein